MKLDQELKKLAEDWSEKAFQKIALALNDPSRGMEGEALMIYNELLAWGWLNDLPIDMDETSEETEDINRAKISMDTHLFYQRIFAMNKYRQLKWQKEHPPKVKKSKWEVVTGVPLKKNEPKKPDKK